MNLDIALKGLFDTENSLRSREGIDNPSFMSEQMQRLSQYLGAVEEHLATIERDYETKQSTRLKEYLIDQEVAVTKAEKLVKIELGEERGQIAFLSRIVSSGWRQVGTIQSRINHIVRETNSTNI